MSAKTKRKRLLALVFNALTATLNVASPAPAQTAWKPTRTVTLVVPYSPGGGTDAQTRAVAAQLQTLWGQPVIVDNTAGADGLIGTRKVIAAKPDGYMLLVQLPSLTLIKHTPAFKGEDPLAQLVPITAFSSLAGVFAANAAVPGHTMSEIVSHCKTAEPPCSVATTENIARLQVKRLKEKAALDSLVVVNYKGGGQAVTDLVANNVNLSVSGLTAVLPHYKAGTLKIVATLGNKRSSVLPDVPTAAESGYPNLAGETWYGLFAPKATPEPVVQAIAAAVHEAVKSESVLKTFATIGAEAVGSTPAEFARQVNADSERMSALTQRFPLE